MFEVDETTMTRDYAGVILDLAPELRRELIEYSMSMGLTECTMGRRIIERELRGRQVKSVDMKSEQDVKAEIASLEKQLRDVEGVEVVGCGRAKLLAKIEALKWVLSLSLSQE
jgi:uncharacterized coiled-coil DUF342 family protein